MCAMPPDCACRADVINRRQLGHSAGCPPHCFASLLLPAALPRMRMQVLYASKPQTAGGPFRSPVGRTVFPGQRATQSIQEPNICINEVRKGPRATSWRRKAAEYTEGVGDVNMVS